MSGKNPPIVCPAVEHQGSSCDTCRKSEELERRELEMSKLVASLKAERLALNSILNASHDRVAGRLPLEIVSYIFQVYSKMHIPEKGNGVFHNSRMTAAPLHLGSICRQWRTIAWSMPNMWTTMTIDICCKINPTTTNLAQEWLERTGVLPLSIRLYVSGDWYHPIEENEEVRRRESILSLIHVINSFSFRWGSLDLEIPYEFLHYVRGSINEGQVSILRQLRLTSIGPPFSIRHFLKANPGHFPKHLNICYVRLDRLDFIEEWPNLTDFTSGSISMKECIALLQRAPYLERLTLQGVRRSGPQWELETEGITHLFLHTLSFSKAGVSSTDVLNFLTLPLLQEFECSSTASSFVSMNNLKTLIERSNCQLKKLTFWQLTRLDSDDIPHQFLHFLTRTPTLETLDLRFRESAHVEILLKNLLNPTLGSSGYPTLLPNIELLRISVDPKFSWGIVADVFEASYLNVGDESDLGGLSISHPRQSLKVEMIAIDSTSNEKQHIDEDALRRLNKLFSREVSRSVSNNIG